MVDTGYSQTLLLASIAVVIFFVLAVLSLLLGLPQIIFYVCAIISIGLGFYLAYNLTKEQQKSATQPQPSKKK